MRDYIFKVKLNREIAKDVFELTLSTDEQLDVQSFKGGQFAHVEVPLGTGLLRRPFCIYKMTKSTVTFLIAKKGSGTEGLCSLKVGTELKVILPLGKGFTLGENDKKVVLLGAGMGCAPLFPVIQTYPDREYYSFMGFHDKSKVICVEEFATYTKSVFCTSDGSFGERGHATDVFLERLEQIKPDVVLICGPHSFMKSAQKIAIDNNLKAYLSTEQRMGCGIGACLVCSCKTVKDGEEHMSRVCADGPVFDVREIIL